MAHRPDHALVRGLQCIPLEQPSPVTRSGALASYYLLSAALLTIMNADLFNNLSDSIEDGSVARYLTRPMPVLAQVFLIGLPDVISQRALQDVADDNTGLRHIRDTGDARLDTALRGSGGHRIRC